MICRLCLKPAAETTNIFDEVGSTLGMALILSKHFWFEPKCDDPISTAICKCCWSKVSDFHEFYLAVEEAHRLLTERFFINNNHNNATDQQKSLSTEKKPTATTDQKIHDTNESLKEEEFMSDNEAHFDNAHFLLEIAGSDIQQDEEIENGLEQSDILEIPETRRVTRSCTIIEKIKTNKKTVKRRERSNKRKEKSIRKIKDSDAEYNKRMHEIDVKIARHMKLTCDICDAVEETFLNLCKHMEKEHRKTGYAVCCNKKFHKRSFLTDHIDKHNNPDKFKCEECDKTFSDKQCLRNHELLKHQPEEVKTHQCQHCPKKFARSYLLDQHRVTHEKRTVPCDKCDRRFPNVSLLSTHIKMVHTNYGSTMCDICAKVIRGRAAFKRHQMEHAGISTPKVQCKICGSWHKDKYALQRHVARHNTSNEEHVCNICGKISPNRGALLSHQRYVHTSERKYKCSVCEKAFKKPVNLKEHMALHTGEFLYNCPHCPRTFNSNANMHSHRKKMHPKEWEVTRKIREEQRINQGEEQTIKLDEAVLDKKLKTIQTLDGGKTRSSLVTSNNFNNDECDGESPDTQSIVFTLD